MASCLTKGSGNTGPDSRVAHLPDSKTSKSTYTFDLDLGDRVTSRTLDIPDKVDPFEYYLGTQVWIDHPKSSVPIKAFRKLEPGEAVRKVKPFSEQEQWIVDQCNRSGIAQGLLTMTRIITSYHMSPPRSIESFCISMLRKAVPYEPLSNRKRDVLRQMVRGDESIEVLRFGSIVPVLIKGRVHCFLPISVVENTTSEWTRYAVMLTPNDSTPTLKAMREKLAESDEEKQRRRQAEHPSSL